MRFLLSAGAPNASNLRTFIENYDRIAKKYNYRNQQALEETLVL